MSDVAFASQGDLPNGWRVWYPPSGRPYWILGTPNAGPDLTPREVELCRMIGRLQRKLEALQEREKSQL
jgi:hypothetical protein